MTMEWRSARLAPARSCLSLYGAGMALPWSGSTVDPLEKVAMEAMPLMSVTVESAMTRGQ
jgi:hypothetical protein